MLLGILCTMTNNFGKKGFYNSQEIGLGKCLVEKGHDVEIYKGVSKKEDEEEIINGRLKIHYIYLKHIGANGYINPSVINPNLDGLLCFSDQQLFLPHVVKYCEKFGIVFVPYVGTAHSLYTGSIKGTITNQLFSLGTLKIYHHYPVIAKTPAAKDELISLGCKDVQVANVGLDISNLNHNFKQTDKKQLRKKYGFSEDSVLLCNISRMDPEKRVIPLIHLFHKIKNKKKFEMLIVGDGELAERVDREISNLHLESCIKRIPKVPYEQMWEIYHMSDYYVNMNRGEIFGMACMEAVFYETSVAAIAAMGPKITLKDMRGHHLCEKDIDIAKWLCSPYPSKTFLEESSQKAITRYSWTACADAFLERIKGKDNLWNYKKNGK